VTEDSSGGSSHARRRQQPLAHRTLARFLSAEDLRRARTGFVRAGSFTVR
jgi:hypothetical protein